MIKKTLLAAAMLTASSAALAEISANVTLASDYVFRGISQTDNQLAIQGGFDWAHESGVYAGVWASNVSEEFFNGGRRNGAVGATTAAGFSDPQTEVDVYAGYSGEYNDFGYDVGVLRYEYPGFGTADTTEIYVSGSYMDFGLSVNYSDELSFLPSSESSWYVAASYDYELPYEVGVSVHVGHSFGDAFDVSAAKTTATNFGLTESYTDWSIGVSKSWMGADFGVTYTDVNIDKDDCDDSFTDICDKKFVASIGKSF